jgi:hypothetical protein
LTYACLGAVLARSFGLACDHMSPLIHEPVAHDIKPTPYCKSCCCILPISPSTDLYIRTE